MVYNLSGCVVITVIDNLKLDPGAESDTEYRLGTHFTKMERVERAFQDYTP